jgi:hypothetical protein
LGAESTECEETHEQHDRQGRAGRSRPQDEPGCRDYEEETEEYLRLGANEYWIVDVTKSAMVVMRRSRGKWVKRTIRPPAASRTQLLPVLEFSIEAVFKTAGLA